MVSPTEGDLNHFNFMENISDATGLPIDQLYFVVIQITALSLAPFLRKVLHPSVVNPEVRQVFVLVSGLILGYCGFGRQAIHLIGLPFLCYLLIKTQSPLTMQRHVMGVALGYLSMIHLTRLIHPETSCLDVTGPLMVMTQKATSLAFNLHDGHKKEDELNSNQKYYAVRKIPTALEYFSYMLQFQTIMAGPIVFYRDYIEYIQGRNFLQKGVKNDANSNSKNVVLEPSPVYPALHKLVYSVICAFIFVSFIQYFPIRRVKEDSFFEEGVFYQFVYLFIATGLERCKYYHAWILADCVCNLSGLGFNGYGSDGKAKWDLVSNVDILDFEFGLSLRDCIQHWNKGTNIWLRMVVYERVKGNGTLWTFALSALWHGFWPGYYLTFATGALITLASRSVRKCLRPHFMGTPAKKSFYDFVTMCVTRVIMTYCTFSFVLLEFWPSMRVYAHWYFWVHILGLASIWILPKIVRQTREAPITNKLSSLVNTSSGVNTLTG